MLPGTALMLTALFDANHPSPFKSFQKPARYWPQDDSQFYQEAWRATSSMVWTDTVWHGDAPTVRGAESALTGRENRTRTV